MRKNNDPLNEVFEFFFSGFGVFDFLFPGSKNSGSRKSSSGRNRTRGGGGSIFGGYDNTPRPTSKNERVILQAKEATKYGGSQRYKI